MNKSINLGGSDRPLHFGFSCLAEFGQMSNMALGNIDRMNEKNMTIQDVLNLVYCGLKHGARKAGNEFKATVQDIGDWLDDAGIEAVKEVFTAFAESQSKQVKKPKPGKK